MDHIFPGVGGSIFFWHVDHIFLDDRTLSELKNNGNRSMSRKDGIGPLVKKAYYLLGRKGLRGVTLLTSAGIRLFRSNKKRKHFAAKSGFSIPTVLIVSVTMACNYNCLGCYSRGRPENEELSTAELDNLFGEAEAMGMLAVVLTGGEPLMRDDLLQIISRHRNLLFIMITNGSLMTAEKAALIGRCTNLVVLISIEGSDRHTDERRGEGAHRAVIAAMKHLKNAGGFFGFAATNNVFNSAYLGSDLFIDDMIDRGCSAGLITEYVPCGPGRRPDWVIGPEQRESFRQRILHLRSSKPIVLVQLPQDEYGEKNICSGAGRASLHINSQGGIEPCPFVSLSCDSIRRGGLMAALKSPFLAAIRSQPHLLSRNLQACSLFEHYPEVKALASKKK